MVSQRTNNTGLLLRLAGLAILAIAVIAAKFLFGHRAPDATTPDVLTYVLALIAFAGASAGSVLLALGGHLFDEVELPARWARRDAREWRN